MSTVTVTITQTEPMLTVEPLRPDVSPNDACVTEWRRLNIVTITGPRTVLFDIAEWLDQNACSGDIEFQPHRLENPSKEAQDAFNRFSNGLPDLFLNRERKVFMGATIIPDRIVWTGASDDESILCKMKWEGAKAGARDPTRIGKDIMKLAQGVYGTSTAQFPSIEAILTKMKWEGSSK